MKVQLALQRPNSSAFNAFSTFGKRRSKGEQKALPSAEVAQFLRDQSSAEDEASAQTLIEEMLSAHLIAQSGDGYFLVANAIRASTRAAPLNAAFEWRQEARPASQVCTCDSGHCCWSTP